MHFIYDVTHDGIFYSFRYAKSFHIYCKRQSGGGKCADIKTQYQRDTTHALGLFLWLPDGVPRRISPGSCLALSLDALRISATKNQSPGVRCRTLTLSSFSSFSRLLPLPRHSRHRHLPRPQSRLSCHRPQHPPPPPHSSLPPFPPSSPPPSPHPPPPTPRFNTTLERNHYHKNIFIWGPKPRQKTPPENKTRFCFLLKIKWAIKCGGCGVQVHATATSATEGMPGVERSPQRPSPQRPIITKTRHHHTRHPGDTPAHRRDRRTINIHNINTGHIPL